MYELIGKAVPSLATEKTTPRAQQRREYNGTRLEDKGSTLGLLVTTELEVLASLKCQLCLGLRSLEVFRWAGVSKKRTLQAVHSSRSTTFLVVFALCTIVSHRFMRGIFRTYLVEDGLGLTTITALLAIITTLSLGEQRGLTSLVLGDLVLRVCPVSVFATNAISR